MALLVLDTLARNVSISLMTVDARLPGLWVGVQLRPSHPLQTHEVVTYCPASEPAAVPRPAPEPAAEPARAPASEPPHFLPLCLCVARYVHLHAEGSYHQTPDPLLKHKFFAPSTWHSCSIRCGSSRGCWVNFFRLSHQRFFMQTELQVTC